MAEYIEIIECRDCESKNCDGCNIFVLSQMLNDGKLDSLMDAHHSIIPAADVAPVVHCKWIDGADSFGAKRGQYRVCSRCNICIPCVTEVAEPYWQYCPNCGARMDGE